MSYNKVILVGYVGRDPEMRYTPDGTAVASFSVATSEYAGAGNPKQTTWWKVTVWRKQAELVAEYVKKGGLVLAEGKMTPDKESGGPRVWADRDGKYRASYEMTADRVVFLGGKQDSDEPSGARSTRALSPVAEDDAIPF